MRKQMTLSALDRLTGALVFALVLLLSGASASAENWISYELGESTLRLPEDWYWTYQDPGIEIMLSGYDVAYQVHAAWRQSDKPLIENDLIVSHAEMTVAGQRAVLSVAKSDALGMYQVEFVDPRPDDGRVFVLKLDFNAGQSDDAAVFFDQLLSMFSYDGATGGASLKLSDDPPMQEGPWTATPPPEPEPQAEVPAPAEPQPQQAPSAAPGNAAASDTEYVAVGETKLAVVDNPEAVRNGPSEQVILNPPKPILVRSIQTYHWNDGQGRSQPGMLAILSESGEVFGPWQAVGKPGQGGVPNAYWYVEPDVILVPGKYALLDSDPSTWATNDAAGNKGFVVISYQQVEKKVTTSPSKPPSDGTTPDARAQADATPMADAAQDTDAAPPRFPEPVREVLFDGAMNERWQGQGVYGYGLEELSVLENGTLAIDIGEGWGWADAGIVSREALIFPPRLVDSDEVGLTVELDPARTTDFQIALLPVADGKRKITLRLLHDSDTGTAIFSLNNGWNEVETPIRGPAALDGMSLAMRPDGSLLVRDNTGTIIAQCPLPDDSTIEGYRISVTAMAPSHQKAAKLALRRVVLVTKPYVRPEDPSVFLEGAQYPVLFGGEVMGTRWARYAASKPYFADVARFEDGMLVVDVPKDNEWGMVGIYSPEPLVWLDRFEGDAYVRLAAVFDPGRTSSFVLMLTPFYSPPKIGLNSVNAVLFWRRTEDGGAKASFYTDVYNVTDPGEPAWEADLPEIAPEQVALVLTPGGIRVFAKDMPSIFVPWAQAASSQGLRVHAFAMPDTWQGPTQMALRRINLERVAGTAETVGPEPGVAPLPVATVFDGTTSPLWEPSGINGADFTKDVRFENGRLVAGFPADTLESGKLGLLSTKPVVTLDERIALSVYRLTATVDPEASPGFEIKFSDEPDADMHGSSSASISLIRHTEGRLAGKYVLELRDGDSERNVWRRLIDADWVEKNWDGTFEIDIGNQWMAARLANGPGVRGPGFFKTGAELYATVYAVPESETAGAQLALEKITGGWLTPEGMSALDRWLLIDKTDFDGAAFLDDLAAGAKRHVDALEKQWLLDLTGEMP